MRYTYSRWKDSQPEGVDADDLMAALSDDVMSDGDVDAALQRITRWGMRGQDGGLPGAQDILQAVRARRQEELARYQLDTMMDEIEGMLDTVLHTERAALDSKLEALDHAGGDAALREALEAFLRRQQTRLDSLPAELGAKMSALADHEFVDEGARRRFDEILDLLRQQVLQAHFKSIKDALGGMSQAELDDFKAMMRDLSEGLRDEVEGGDPDFDRFMAQHGRYFPDADSFRDLAEHLRQQGAYMESILNSLSPHMRRSLEDALRSILWDEQIQADMASISELLDVLAPAGPPSPTYDFTGSESLTLEEAMQLMRRLQDLDRLEAELKRAHETGDPSAIDLELTARGMGESTVDAVMRLQQLGQILEEAGYADRHGEGLTLTSRGMRVIGQKALQDIFRNLDRDAFGNHPLARHGTGGDRAEETKRYEFGDTFMLDITSTVRNAVQRGAGEGVELAVTDFEVFRTEHLVQSSTVLMLDMSRSMPLRGCLVAAKKVALALNSLIATQFPRDRLYIIGFSDFARELKPEDLHRMSWGDYVYGTNMQHGFHVARRLLARHRAGNKQIVLITDGEPTAHFEGNQVHFAYPPTFRTFQETLREVKRCTQEGIVINTFMLERSHYLADFVNQMTRINRGRAFFASPERLGDYVLVDYVASKGSAIR